MTDRISEEAEVFSDEIEAVGLGRVTAGDRRLMAGDGQVVAAARQELDEELEAKRKEALRRVRTFGDPVLRGKALPVERFDGTLAEEIGRMVEIMTGALGVGLAATQLGIMHRMLVYKPSPGGPVVVLVNPLREWHSAEHEVAEEGCLSLPGVAVDIDRPLHVRVTAQNGDGEDILVEASGLDARVVQHEMDHLDGVLIVDRASKEQRQEAIRVLRGTKEPRERTVAEPQGI